MPPLSTTAANMASSSAVRPKKRRWTREQLLRNLQMIGELAAPLPPTLPPSPPASRAASPAAGFKRKLPSSSDPDTVKRPRTSSISERQTHYHNAPQHQQPSHQSQSQPPQPQPPSVHARQPASTPHLASRSEPCEDGEVREEPAAVIPVARASAMDVPIRRPKKGKPGMRHFDQLHDKYHNEGRMFKYSGDFRFFSTYPPTHREYRPLPDPPPPSSPYHKHGGLIARLELLDALICFTYSLWIRDYGRRSCNRETWKTIEAFLVWCKQKWQVEEGINDAEKAFLGLIWMIEAFIQGRQMIYAIRGHLDSDMDKVHEGISKKIAAAAAGAVEGDRPLASSLLTGKAPPMLPSPSSTNSTPVNRDDGTPSNSGSRPPQAAANAAPRQQAYQYKGAVPVKQLPEHLRDYGGPIPERVMNAMEAVTEPIGSTLVQDLKDLTAGYSAAAWCIQTAQHTLNLPLLRRCFPNTWARMMYSTLLPTEEHEPDFEDEEGELFWPDQCINGEGIGWVCLMGKAMIKEFGKAYGYKGLDGVVPKPKPEETTEKGHGTQQPSQRSGPPPGHGSSSSSQRPPIPSGPPR